MNLSNVGKVIIIITISNKATIISQRKMKKHQTTTIMMKGLFKVNIFNIYNKAKKLISVKRQIIFLHQNIINYDNTPILTKQSSNLNYDDIPI